MLTRLIINNVALIAKLEMEFETGLNILTGETGAGKSIIVDSLMLLLGGRYDKTLLKYGTTEGFVEGFFTDVDVKLFEEVGLIPDEDAIINRRFNSEGKNIIKINGQSVTLTMLKRFSQKLVDIYGQNEHQSLIIPAKHLDILDYYARQNILQPLSELESLAKDYNENQRKLSDIGDEEQRKRNIDILQYQIDEIHKAAIKENEEDEIVNMRKILFSSERIKSCLGETIVLINGTESSTGIGDLLLNAAKSLGHIAALSPIYEELYSRADAIMAEINDILATAENEIDKIGFEEDDLDNLEKRLDAVRNIRRKYGDYVAMNKFLVKSEKELEFLLNSDEMYEKLLKEQESIKHKIYDISLIISTERRKCAKLLEKKVIFELEELGMKDSRFEIVFSDFPSYEDCGEHISKNGMDKAEFYLSSNAGQPLLPLAKIISGGEMSRFMLALKVISSATDTVQTMIFDEIDAGISGKIGRIIAQKLARISKSCQVLCVTHLPQIAAMADIHHFIDKAQKHGETVTSITKLEPDKMISEISRLSGGQDISSQAYISAKEIKDWSDNFKKSI